MNIPNKADNTTAGIHHGIDVALSDWEVNDQGRIPFESNIIEGFANTTRPMPRTPPTITLDIGEPNPILASVSIRLEPGYVRIIGGFPEFQNIFRSPEIVDLRDLITHFPREYILSLFFVLAPIIYTPHGKWWSIDFRFPEIIVRGSVESTTVYSKKVVVLCVLIQKWLELVMIHSFTEIRCQMFNTGSVFVFE